jgi:hypothetical protein
MRGLSFGRVRHGHSLGPRAQFATPLAPHTTLQLRHSHCLSCLAPVCLVHTKRREDFTLVAVIPAREPLTMFQPMAMGWRESEGCSASPEVPPHISDGIVGLAPSSLLLSEVSFGSGAQPAPPSLCWESTSSSSPAGPPTPSTVLSHPRVAGRRPPHVRWRPGSRWAQDVRVSRRPSAVQLAFLTSPGPGFRPAATFEGPSFDYPALAALVNRSSGGHDVTSLDGPADDGQLSQEDVIGGLPCPCILPEDYPVGTIQRGCDLPRCRRVDHVRRDGELR